MNVTESGLVDAPGRARANVGEAPPRLRLRIDEDELATCVACGLCLPHCPTYRVTGEESASPRGRIAAMRQVHAGAASADLAFQGFMDACVQCRACEVACPSGVPFGRLMEATRETLASETRYVARWQRLGYAVLGHHRLLLALSSLGALAQRLDLVPPSLARRLSLPRLPLRRPSLRATAAGAASGAVWLFTGCVMDAWMRPTHAAVKAVVEATGTGVALPGPGGDCCGALHTHAGLGDEARALARRVMASMPGDAPVLVDSAGCGAALKEYGHLLRTPEAAAFSARVRDVHEWLCEPAGSGGRAQPAGSGERPLDRLPRPERRLPYRVAVQDPCHLRHVQRAHAPVRAVLEPFAELAELDDEGLCCGAGGAYAALHPEMAADLRRRKVEAIGRTGAPVVASANPGCALHLSSAGLRVRHPLELVADALGLTPERRRGR